MLSTTVRSLAQAHWCRVFAWRRSVAPEHMRLPLCSICDKPVQLENSKTDEDGKAIHEECYILKLKQNHAPKPAPATLNP
jgi:hypothetical protein